jgi:hypothetical protein
VGKAADFDTNAERLARALEVSRREAGALADEQERSRLTQAIAQFSQYVDLLREASPPSEALYSFKLEFGDGQWNLAEKELGASPHVGDSVEFEPGRRWRVRGSQLVQSGPARNRPREFFVCVPA